MPEARRIIDFLRAAEEAEREHRGEQPAASGPNVDDGGALETPADPEGF